MDKYADGMMFIPNFVKINLFVQILLEGIHNAHRCSEDIVSWICSSQTKKAGCKGKYRKYFLKKVTAVAS
jgi:hypothetical protein